MLMVAKARVQNTDVDGNDFFFGFSFNDGQDETEVFLEHPTSLTDRRMPQELIRLIP